MSFHDLARDAADAFSATLMSDGSTGADAFDDTLNLAAEAVLWFNVAGTVKITTVGGTSLTVVGVAGSYFPTRITRLWATGTDAALQAAAGKLLLLRSPY